MGFLDDVINPVGAITGVDPVKQMTGFTGTGFDKKSGGSSSSSGGGGSSAGNTLNSAGGQGTPTTAQYISQFNASQNTHPFTSMGNQLASMQQQLMPQQYQNPLAQIASPSAQNVASAVTAQTVNSQLQNPFRGMQQGFSPWG